MSGGRSYNLSPRDGTGLFLGLGVAEIVVIGSGFMATVGLRLLAAPVTMAALPVLLAAGAARLRIGGRPLYRWLPLLATWAASTALGRRRWHGSLPLLPAQGDRAAPQPPVMRGLDIVEATNVPGTTGERIAAVRDRRAARLTAVIPVRARQFVGADASTQDALLAGWGDVLAACAASSSPVTQIGWSHQAVPSTLATRRRWKAELPDDRRAGPEPDGYETLVDEVASFAVEHETLVSVTVSGRDIAGRGRLLDRAAAHLPAAMDDVRSSLTDAGVDAGEPFAVADLWRLLRRRSDPDATTRISAGDRGSLAARMGLVGRGAEAGPLAVEVSWDAVRIDGAWHRAYWIEAWPRRPVPADWLAGFLASPESTTMTVLYSPVDPARSQRRIDSHLVKLSAHRARKEHHARRVTETEHRTEQDVHDLEAELASGHAEVLYLGLVCVTATSLDDLDRRCHEVEHAARGAQLSLRILHGRQDVAWAATLPLGLASPGLVDVVGL